MLLEETIKYHTEIADANERKAIPYTEGKLNNPDGYARAVCEEFELVCLDESTKHRQLAEWLRELQAYREILANADKIIESEYGCVIIEGYADVIDQMIEVYMEVNAYDT